MPTPTSSTTETFTHDVFLSHSAKDKAMVRPLAERLRKDGLNVWSDKWEAPRWRLSFELKHPGKRA